MSASAMVALIQQYDIGPNRARQNAESELKRFSIEDVRRILDCLQPLDKRAGSRDICGPVFNRHEAFPIWMQVTLWSIVSLGTAFMLPFQVGAATYLLFRGKFRAIWQELPRPTFDLIEWGREFAVYIKAPRHLVVQSIKKGAALCVNRRGQFSLRDNGYAMMSHVWGETCGWQSSHGWGPVDISLRRKGIVRRQFLEFFDRCEAEWLWVDVIAMPEVLEDMSDDEKEATERLRVSIINCLRDIITKADKVVVIDTLLLRLSTRSPVDVAAILCLGFWMTRLWTFIECRLAKKVAIKTRDWSFDLDEVISFIVRTAINDQHRYYGILLRLVHTRDETVHGFPPDSLLESAYWGGQMRFTDVTVDQARVLFPLLDMQWVFGWTLEDGLSKILAAYPDDAEWIQRWCQHHSISFKPASLPDAT